MVAPAGSEPASAGFRPAANPSQLESHGRRPQSRTAFVLFPKQADYRLPRLRRWTGCVHRLSRKAPTLRSCSGGNTHLSPVEMSGIEPDQQRLQGALATSAPHPQGAVPRPGRLATTGQGGAARMAGLANPAGMLTLWRYQSSVTCARRCSRSGDGRRSGRTRTLVWCGRFGICCSRRCATLPRYEVVLQRETALSGPSRGRSPSGASRAIRWRPPWSGCRAALTGWSTRLACWLVPGTSCNNSTSRRSRIATVLPRKVCKSLAEAARASAGGGTLGDQGTVTAGAREGLGRHLYRGDRASCCPGRPSPR